MNEIDLAVGIATLFQVRPPSVVRKISVLGSPAGAVATHAIRAESAVNLQTLIRLPDDPSGVTSLHWVPPSAVRSTAEAPNVYSTKVAQPDCASTIWIDSMWIVSVSVADAPLVGICLWVGQAANQSVKVKMKMARAVLILVKSSKVLRSRDLQRVLSLVSREKFTLVAGGGGFEPPLTGSEPVVLPLDDPPAEPFSIISDER